MTSVVDSEEDSGEDSAWPEAGSSVPERLLSGGAGDPFSCCPPDSEASGAGSSGPPAVLLGSCVVTAAPPGEVLGRSAAEPEAARAGGGGPKGVAGGRGCGRPAAWGCWLEAAAPERGWPRDLPGSREALAGEPRREWPEVAREGLVGAGLLGDGGLAEGSGREEAEDSVEDLGWHVPPSSPAGSCAETRGGAFTGPSGAGSRLLWRPGLFPPPRPELAC